MTNYLGDTVVAGFQDTSHLATIDTAQTISGAKTFTGTVNVPTSSSTSASSLEAVNVSYLNSNGYATGTKSMPSGTYINVSSTFGTNFTVPANGYVSYLASSTNANQYMNIQNDTSFVGFTGFSAGPSNAIWCNVVCKRGDQISVNGNMGGGIINAWFVYAQGEI